MPKMLPIACCVPITKPKLRTSQAESAAQVFRALADPHRVKIMNLLLNAPEDVCVCDITEVTGLSQPTTSFHLKKLMQAGLITRAERGTWAYYSIVPGALDSLSTLFEEAR